MTFHCLHHWNDGEIDKWIGYINSINCFGSHYEVFINSRSSIRVLVGRSTSGLFACLPDFMVGCHLSKLDDVFYNKEKLNIAMDNLIDAITVANALNSISDMLDFNQ